MTKQKTNKLIDNINSVIGRCNSSFAMAINEQLLKMAEADKELYIEAQPYFKAAMDKVRQELPFVREAEDY